MKEISFQPGKFQPIVEISQRDSGVPDSSDTDFAGLEEVAVATLQVSLASSRGFGSVISDPTPVHRLARIIGSVLALRNIVEQFLFVGFYTRLSTPIRNAQVSPLEPLVRAYNYYGHFELDGKLFVSRDLISDMIRHLFQLKQYATAEIASGEKYTQTAAQFDMHDIDLAFYTVNSEGEVSFSPQKSLRSYIVDIIIYLTTFDGLDELTRLPWIRYATSISTEASLNNFLRSARQLEGFVSPNRQVDTTPSDDHKKAMKKLFGKEFSSPGDTIPVSAFTGSITNAYNLLRRISLERSYGMKTVPIPKYEGGSAAQLAAYVDDVLVSQVPLSLADSTAAVAFTTSYGVNRLYKSAPGNERAELLRELVSQSLIGH
nr:coat protein [Erysiphe necator associated partitivirus 7]